MSIKEIAKRAQVSPATVSRVLNNPDYKCSSPQIRERIRKAAMGAQGGEKKKKGQILVSDPDEILEVLQEAFKQKGRFTNVMITSGSILSGEELLEDELNYHIELLQKIGTLFKEKRFPSQLIGTAYNKKQLERLYEETGLMSYTTDIEVLNESAFNHLCPGKEKSFAKRAEEERKAHPHFRHLDQLLK